MPFWSLFENERASQIARVTSWKEASSGSFWTDKMCSWPVIMVFKCENCDLHVLLLPHRCRVAWNFFRFYGSRTRKDLDRKHLGIRCISDSCEATCLLSRTFAYLGAIQKSQHMRSTRDETRTHNLLLKGCALSIRPHELGNQCFWKLYSPLHQTPFDSHSCLELNPIPNFLIQTHRLSLKAQITDSEEIHQASLA